MKKRDKGKGLERERRGREKQGRGWSRGRKMEGSKERREY